MMRFMAVLVPSQARDPVRSNSNAMVPCVAVRRSKGGHIVYLNGWLRSVPDLILPSVGYATKRSA